MVNEMRIVIMGLGYIGLPTAALVARSGYKVHGVDVNPAVIDTINKGKIHIEEPSLEGLVCKVVDDGRLKAHLKPVEADIFLIAVPTPILSGNKPDVTYVMDATRAIAPFVRAGNLILLESTSPVGTTEAIAREIFSARPELKGKLAIAYCPERVIPGQILHELRHNDRVVGGIDEESTKRAVAFYQTFVEGQVKPTKCRTAEMVKLAENAYRDVNIAYANELSMICENHDIEVRELIDLANLHPRVNILQPGCGVGGHCIAIDPWFIVDLDPETAKLIRTAREVNLRKTDWVVERIEARIKAFQKKTKKQPVIAILGLTYKPDVDDLRESPALEIAVQLAEKGHRLDVCEPHLLELPVALAGRSNVKRIEVTDIGMQTYVYQLVPHKEFRGLKTESF